MHTEVAKQLQAALIVVSRIDVSVFVAAAHHLLPPAAVWMTIMLIYRSNDHTLAYQSRVGPVEWLQPYTDDSIRCVCVCMWWAGRQDKTRQARQAGRQAGDSSRGGRLATGTVLGTWAVMAKAAG